MLRQNYYNGILALILYCICITVYSWDSTGHRLTAWIAYQQLTPTAKSQVDKLTAILDGDYPPLQRFLFASTVPDQIRNNNITVYNTWHYINLPFSFDGTPALPPNQENVVWAIQKNQAILENPASDAYAKATALRFLIHFVGDVHQPLHCSNFFSHDFPHGDQGGNLFLIDNALTPNLHKFWDQGAGLFHQYSRFYPLSTKEVKYLAKIIQKRYPPGEFGNRISQMDPNVWAQQCFDLAKTVAYQHVQPNAVLSAAYVQQAQQVVGSQIALAGDRLAYLLNTIFAHKEMDNGA